MHWVSQRRHMPGSRIRFDLLLDTLSVNITTEELCWYQSQSCCCTDFIWCDAAIVQSERDLLFLLRYSRKQLQQTSYDLTLHLISSALHTSPRCCLQLNTWMMRKLCGISLSNFKSTKPAQSGQSQPRTPRPWSHRWKGREWILTVKQSRWISAKCKRDLAARIKQSHRDKKHSKDIYLRAMENMQVKSFLCNVILWVMLTLSEYEFVLLWPNLLTAPVSWWSVAWVTAILKSSEKPTAAGLTGLWRYWRLIDADVATSQFWKKKKNREWMKSVNCYVICN